MKWGKIVLLFQAIVTLILGIVLFSQVFNIKTEMKKFEINLTEENLGLPNINEIGQTKKRIETGAYILLFVSLIEISVIVRLVG